MFVALYKASLCVFSGFLDVCFSYRYDEQDLSGLFIKCDDNNICIQICIQIV